MGFLRNLTSTLLVLVLSVNIEGGAIPLKQLAKDPKIVIVGSGVAGIAATTFLIENGFKNIVILEAEDYWGGRILTVPYAANVIDIGAQWCHGQGENPVYKMGKPYDLFDITYDPEEYEFSRPNGDIIAPKKSNAMMEVLIDIVRNANTSGLAQYDGALGDFVIQKFYEVLEAPQYNDIDDHERRQVVEYYHRWFNADMASENWYDLSGPGQLDYLEYDGHINVNWKDNGYGTVFKLLTKSFPKPNSESINVEEKIRLNKTVTNIQYNDNTVKVSVRGGEVLEADHVIVTVSVGVLKDRYKELFTPALPQYKINAINGLSFGIVDKLFMEFRVPFWPDGWTGLKIVWTDAELAEIRKRKDKWIEGIISVDRVDYQPNLLMGWVWGSFARQMEPINEAEVRESCLFIMRKFLPKMTIPNPVNFRRTTWYTNKNFRGSYSYHSLKTAELGTSSADLARPIKNKMDVPIIHFAGEATSDHYWSTVHGAIDSGWREADRIISLYRK